jgi:hypothetical protein
MSEPHLRAHQIRVGVTLGRDVGDAGTKHQQQVGAAQHVHLVRRIREAHVARIEPMRIGQQVLGAERHHRRQLPLLEESQQRLAAARAIEAAPAQHQRTDRRFEPAAQRRHIGRRRGGTDRGLWADRRSIDLRRQHVLRHRDHHRPRRAGRGGLDRPQHGFRHASRIGDLGAPLGDRAVHLAVVDLLERVAAHIAGRHLPDDEDERHLVLLGGVHRNRGIAGARPAAHAGDAGPAGEPRIRDRHEAGPGFVAAHYGVDVSAAVERVEQPQIAFAWHAEQPVDTVRREAVDDQFTRCAHRSAMGSPAARWRRIPDTSPGTRRATAPARQTPCASRPACESRGSPACRRP